MEGSRSDWPKEVGQDSVSSGSLLRSGCQPGELFYTLARLAIHCNHSKRTQCQYQTAVLDRLARNRYNRLRCSPTVCRGNDRCYTQHRVIGFLRLLPIAVPDSRELDIAKWCNKVLHFPSFAAKRPRELGMNHRWVKFIYFNCPHSRSLSISSLHFVKSNDGAMMDDGCETMNSMILDRTKGYSSIILSAIKISMYIWHDSLNSRFPRNTTNVTNYLKSILKLFLRSNVVSSLRNDWKNVFFNFY